jgi:hypothetical protein
MRICRTLRLDFISEKARLTVNLPYEKNNLGNQFRNIRAVLRARAARSFSNARLDSRRFLAGARARFSRRR